MSSVSLIVWMSFVVQMLVVREFSRWAVVAGSIGSALLSS
jgi:hypothetical protein